MLQVDFECNAKAAALQCPSLMRMYSYYNDATMMHRR